MKKGNKQQMGKKKVFFISSSTGAEDDDETSVLTKILSEEHGLPCERVEWDSPAVFENWSQEHLAIVQSPWNYHLKYDEFSSFLDQARRACGLWFVVCGLWLTFLHTNRCLACTSCFHHQIAERKLRVCNPVSVLKQNIHKGDGCFVPCVCVSVIFTISAHANPLKLCRSFIFFVSLCVLVSVLKGT